METFTCSCYLATIQNNIFISYELNKQFFRKKQFHSNQQLYTLTKRCRHHSLLVTRLNMEVYRFININCLIPANDRMKHHTTGCLKAILQSLCLEKRQQNITFQRRVIILRSCGGVCGRPRVAGTMVVDVTVWRLQGKKFKDLTQLDISHIQLTYVILMPFLDHSVQIQTFQMICDSSQMNIFIPRCGATTCSRDGILISYWKSSVIRTK